MQRSVDAANSHAAPARPTRTRAVGAIGAVTAVAAVGCALYAATRSPAPAPDLTEPARAFEGKLRERAAALSARVATLSDLPRLAAAVATDATTVRDLTGEELAFRPRPGEIITIAQRLRDGRRVPLLTLPDGAEGELAEPGKAATTAGTRVSARSGTVIVSQTAEIKPTERADELIGLLTISSATDPQELSAPLLASAPGVRVEMGSAVISYGAPFPRAPGAGTRVEAHLPDGTVASLVFATALAQSSRTPWIAAAALAAVALAALGLAARGGTPPPRPAGEDLARGTSGGSPIPSVGGTLVAPEPSSAPRLPASAGTSPAAGSSSPSTSPPLPSSGSSWQPPSGGPRYPTTAPLVEGQAALPTAFAATMASSAVPPVAGAEQRIGRYALVRPLGQGGMAEVFLARAEGEAGFGKLVAFKVLQPAFASNPAVVDLFLDEARLVAGLDHPNIVQTHDLGKAGDRYFIAMEYVDGSDLARLIERIGARGERIPVPCALGILCRVCDGLHAAHTATGPDGKPLWLVHRDVKSANVFVSRTGAVKVGDFGIAKATHAVRISRTEVGQVKGTPGTMAPEQRLGQAVDRRADVYGVGAIAYELLSGAPVNLDLVALAARGIAGWPHLPPLSSLRPDVPRELEAAILKALSYEPAQRFEDCAAFEHALRTAGATTGLAEDKAIGAWARAELDRAQP
ncbi:MAG TPA: serine/threonine-protein kinase [Polyangia bacterium]